VIDSGVNPIEGARMAEGINVASDGLPHETGDERGHGTAVAQTILSVAPYVEIVPIRVTDARGILESPEVLDAAFEWVSQNAERLHIGIVCAAVSDMSHSQSDQPWRGSPLQRILTQLRAKGIAVVAPAGNWYPFHRAHAPQGMAWPAILRETVSVGELSRTQDGLKLSRLTQRLHGATTVFAEAGPPGETSGAAARVAGLLAALKTAEPTASVDDLIAELLAGASIVEDQGLNWPALYVIPASFSE
jgi:hypothetical protein